DCTPGATNSPVDDVMLRIDSGQDPALLIVSGLSANEPRQTLPKLPASAIAVATLPVPCRPETATSTKGAVGSLLLMRMMAASVVPLTVGENWTVNSMSSPGASIKGVAGIGRTVKSAVPSSRWTLEIRRSATPTL